MITRFLVQLNKKDFMDYFERHPNIFRLLFVLFFTYLLSLAAFNLFRFAGSATDENLFANSPSRIYIVKTFHSGNNAGTQDDNSLKQWKSQPDSLYAGDLVISVNGHGVYTLTDWRDIVRQEPQESNLDIKVFRSVENKNYKYHTAISTWPDSSLREIPPTACVLRVNRGGASYRAGMQKGDLIVKINGESFGNSNEADLILRRAQIGKTIDYEVLRQNQKKILKVTLAKYNIHFSIIVLLISSLVFMSVGFFLALKRPQFKAARMISLSLLMFGFCFSVLTTQRDVTMDLFARLRNLTMSTSFFLATVLALDTRCYFPRERPEIAKNIKVRSILYVIAIVSAIVVLVIDQDGLYLLVSLFLLFLYHGFIRFIFRKQNTAESKKASRKFNIAIIVVISTAIIMGVIFSYTQNLLYFGYIGIPLVFFPLIYLYTIGRYNLFDLDLRIRRNIQYIIATSIWAVLLCLIFFNILFALPKIEFNLPNIRFTDSAIEVIDSPLLPIQKDVAEKIILMIFAIALTTVFWKLGKKGQQIINEKFYRGEYDYRRAASVLAEVMATNLNMMDLARGLVQKLAALVHLDRVGVMFFRNQEICCCQEAFGFDGQVWNEFCVKTNQELLHVLSKGHSDSRYNVEYLPDELKQDFKRHGFQHVLAIRSKEKLLGTLLIGGKLAETPFDKEDLEFLTATAKQTSVAIENAFLYEELAEQERLKHELGIARRIQLGSLPQKIPHMHGLDISGLSIPATEVGGDYFDYLSNDSNKMTVIIGDVSGKGISAALYMSKVQGILRSIHRFHLKPGELFIRANEILCQDLEKNYFVTALGACFDTITQTVVLARAGHLPLYYFNKRSQTIEKLTPKGIGLGLEQNGIFEKELIEKSIPYTPGDVFLFVTDGLTEALDEHGNEFGEDNFDIIKKNNADSAASIRDKILNKVKSFTRNRAQHDDQTIVVVKAI